MSQCRGHILPSLPALVTSILRSSVTRPVLRRLATSSLAASLSLELSLVLGSASIQG